MDDPSVEAPSRPLSYALTIGWLGMAAAASVAVPIVIGAGVPVFTLVWLAIAALVIRRRRSPSVLGLARPPRGELVRVTGASMLLMTGLFGVAELTTHPYRDLLDLVRDEPSPDSTFAWVIEYGIGGGLVGFAVYGALVTIFAEEIVFRGALMTRLRPHGRAIAVAGTTIAFAAVQALPAALLPPRAAVGFLVIDAVLAVGVVGGLAAYRTRSIYPCIVAITVANVVVLAGVA
jgi:membrane protease YdiL (CAAX protease family)